MVETLVAEYPKALQILLGAKSAFVELGYEGTSVDEIARRAGVGKATIYSYFHDKREIFAAVVKLQCQQNARRASPVRPPDQSVQEFLHRFARGYLKVIYSPAASQMLRLVIAEVGRFPDIGREFFESGPKVAIQFLARVLSDADSHGELRIPDAHVAANHFLSLCRGELFFQSLLGMRPEITPSEIETAADLAVTTFLQAFRRE